MEPECNKPMNHCTQFVKGMTTVAKLSRVVTPYPVGTQAGPLRPPYGCLRVALRPPYGCLMVALWLPYAPLMVAQMSPDQGMIFMDVH